MKPMMLPEKVAAWLKILNAPRFKRMLENARNTREKIAADVLQRHFAEESRKETK